MVDEPNQGPIESWIGKVTKDGKDVAVLGADGKWTCPAIVEGQPPKRALAAWLNLMFDPAKATGAGVVLPYGHMAVSRAAVELRGDVVFARPLEPLAEGQVS